MRNDGGRSKHSFLYLIVPPFLGVWGENDKDNSNYKSVYHSQHSVANITPLLSPLKGGTRGGSPPRTPGKAALG